jgi:hypothetical protein
MAGPWEMVAAVATALATLIAVFSAMDARRSSKQGHSEARHQSAVALASLLNDHSESIRAWADEAIDWIAQSHSMTYLDPARMQPGEFFVRRSECIWRLSALIDRGRPLFPNVSPDKYGTHKPGAYQGFAPTVLEHLKSVQSAVKQLSTDVRNDETSKKLGGDIVAHRREFVSEVQRAVDPRERENRLRHPDIMRSTM